MPIRVLSKRVADTPSRSSSSSSMPFGLPQPPAGYPQKPAGISLCMIVKNEERFLEQCLRSIADAVDEICIVDTGSTDRTVEIARAFDARVETREWRNDFAWARNEALALATRRWIIMLDADEELKPESKATLRELSQTPAYTTGVWIRCYNRSDDYRGTGEMSHALVRVFPNSERVRFRGMIHEFVTLDNSTTGLGAVNAPISIVHHGYLKEVVESRGKAQRNLTIVEAAAAADPTDPFVWFNVGSTAFMMGDYEKARDALEKMRELNGRTTRGFIANGHAVLAEVYCDKLGDPKKGEEISRAALEFSPHYANAHFQLAKALVAQQRFDEARAAFREAIEDGKYAHLQFVIDDQVYRWKAHSEIGSTYVMQGDDRSAIEWFRKGLENAPNVQPLLLNLARALERVGHMEEARATFKRVHDEFRDDFGAVDYINFLLRRREGAAALGVIDDAHAGLSDEIAGQLLLAAAQIARQHEDAVAARRYLELAAVRAPYDAEILNWLEALYRESGESAALATLLDRERQSLPRKPADFLRRSYQANAANDFEAGLAFALRGLALDSRNEHLHYNAAVAASARGESARALDHLGHIVSAESDVYPHAQRLRAQLLAQPAADQGSPDALKARAQHAEAAGDVEQAERALREMLDRDPQHGAVELAAFLLRHGRFEEAAAAADVGLRA